MPENGTITLVPSVHFSPTHSRRVRETIRAVEPDLVAVELDEGRFERLDRKSSPDPAELARELPPATAATYNAIRAIQQTVVRLYGLDTEETDMETAIQTAVELDTEIALIDDPIRETMTALSDRVGLATIPKVLLRIQLMGPADRLKQLELMRIPFTDITDGDDVQPMVDQMRQLVPEIVEVLIDRRDRTMAERLHVLRHEGYDVVAIIGAGHHNGIRRALDELEAEGAKPDVTVPIRSSSRTVTRVPID